MSSPVIIERQETGCQGRQGGWGQLCGLPEQAAKPHRPGIAVRAVGLHNCLELARNREAGLLITAFCWGGVTHILTDAMTVSGVPLRPYSDRRFHLFGGRFSTGEPVEYGISACVVFVCIGLMNLMPSGSWAPFFYDLGGIL